jgi:hypothetical protein
MRRSDFTVGRLFSFPRDEFGSMAGLFEYLTATLPTVAGAVLAEVVHDRSHLRHKFSITLVSLSL